MSQLWQTDNNESYFSKMVDYSFGALPTPAVEKLDYLKGGSMPLRQTGVFLNDGKSHRDASSVNHPVPIVVSIGADSQTEHRESMNTLEANVVNF